MHKKTVYIFPWYRRWGDTHGSRIRRISEWLESSGLCTTKSFLSDSLGKKPIKLKRIMIDALLRHE